MSKVFGQKVTEAHTRFSGVVSEFIVYSSGYIGIKVERPLTSQGDLIPAKWLEARDCVTESGDNVHELISEEISDTVFFMEPMGRWAKDDLTGFRGTIIATSRSMTGDAQYLLTTTTGTDGKYPERLWVDAERCEWPICDSNPATATTNEA